MPYSTNSLRPRTRLSPGWACGVLLIRALLVLTNGAKVNSRLGDWRLSARQLSFVRLLGRNELDGFQADHFPGGLVGLRFDGQREGPGLVEPQPAHGVGGVLRP